MGTARIEATIAETLATKDNVTLAARYDTWAATYDDDTLLAGNRNVTLAAALICRHQSRVDIRILDAGAGTGILGEVLALLGFRRIAALDLSVQMLDIARDKKIYESITIGVLGEKLDYESHTFDVTASTGVFVPGHAPPGALDELVRVTRPGGLIVFSAWEAWLEDGGLAKVDELRARECVELVETVGPYSSMYKSSTRSYLHALRVAA